MISSFFWSALGPTRNHIYKLQRYFDMINKIMINGVMIEQNPQFSLNLITNLKSSSQLQLKLDLNVYDSYQLFLLQECDRMELHKKTKYLAKTYFDIVVTQLPEINATNASLYLLTSILLAVKFNESRDVSDGLSVGDLVMASEGRFQHKDFIDAEVEMLKLLKFRLHFPSPYEPSPSLMPIIMKYAHKKARLAKIQIIIDFALTLPSLILVSSDEIFLACFLMIFEGVLYQEDLEQVSRYINDGLIVGQIRKEIEKGLSELGEPTKAKKLVFNI